MPFEHFSDDELAPPPRQQRHALPSRQSYGGSVAPRTLTAYPTHRFSVSQSNNPTTFNFQNKSIPNFTRTGQGNNNLRSSSAVEASYNPDTMTFYRHRHTGNQPNLPPQSQNLPPQRHNSASLQQRTTHQRQALPAITDRAPSLVSRQDWTNFVNMKAKPSASSNPSTLTRRDGASGEAKIKSIPRVDQTLSKPTRAVRVAEGQPPLQVLLDLDDTSQTKDSPTPFHPAALNDLLGLDFSQSQDGGDNLLDKEMKLLDISESIAPECIASTGSGISFSPIKDNTNTTTTTNSDDDDKSSDSSSNGNNSSSNDNSEDLTDGEQIIISLQKLEDLRNNLRMRSLVWSDLLEHVDL